MNMLTANQISQGENQRLGNCVHNRTAPLRDPHQLDNAYELELSMNTMLKAFSHIPARTEPINRDDLLTSRVFIAEADFIAQTTVNLAEGT